MFSITVLHEKFYYLTVAKIKTEIKGVACRVSGTWMMMQHYSPVMDPRLIKTPCEMSP